MYSKKRESGCYRDVAVVDIVKSEVVVIGREVTTVEVKYVVK